VIRSMEHNQKKNHMETADKVCAIGKKECLSNRIETGTDAAKTLKWLYVRDCFSFLSLIGCQIKHSVVTKSVALVQ
jgi:hypothetical protein